MPDGPPTTVTVLTRRIKQSLETSFPSVLVQGELSNCKLHTSGHFYFVLKDESAQIAGVLWRSRVGGLSFSPQDGMKVVVTGRVTVYEVRGAYQLDASSIRPVGVGELQQAFEELKRRLDAEGLFALEHKRPLPEFPARIGIVTSPTGAALQDMLRVLRKRFPAVEVVLAPARVQGAGAAAEIAAAIRDCNALGGIDVLIVGRGGGSLEDLWAFNEEVVARAIAASRIPVVSAVGHEVDVTIADFVADERAPTPTAAAARVVPDRRVLLDNLRDSWYSMHENVRQLISRRRETVRHFLTSYGFNRPLDVQRRHAQRLDELQRTMVTAAGHRVGMAGARVQAVQQRLAALDPERVLHRGYALVLKEGTIVSTRTALHPDDDIDIRFHDGTVSSRVS
jgi:exodeoxyribonuclease VII large subunit